LKKQILILKQSATGLIVHQEHMEIITPKESYIVAYRHIDAIYLNKAIRVDIGTCYALSQKVALYLIDHNGYLLAELKEVTDETV